MSSSVKVEHDAAVVDVHAYASGGSANHCSYKVMHFTKSAVMYDMRIREIEIRVTSDSRSLMRWRDYMLLKFGVGARTPCSRREDLRRRMRMHGSNIPVLFLHPGRRETSK